MTRPDDLELASVLTAAVHQAGARIMAHYGIADVELKHDRSPVTAADREADAILVDALAKLAPGIPVISEESSPKAETGPRTRFFLVDPLDGTREFIHGRDEFTVNVALVEDGAPVFGLVYAPAKEKLYLTLSRDRASTTRLDPAGPAPEFSRLALTPITTRAPGANGLTAAVSRSHLDDRTRDYLRDHEIAETYPSGSSLKFCSIAEGLADVYPRFGRTMEWDTAAGHAVLAAAGGVVLDETGARLAYGKRERDYANPGFIAWGRAP